jgi:hypothetical protein
MQNLIVKIPFFITRTSNGEVIANVGDTITVKDKGAEYFYIVKLNGKNIFSTWQRKSWIIAKCN